MSAAIDVGRPGRPSGQTGAARILRGTPRWMLVTVALFVLAGLAGLFLMWSPDYSRLVFRQSLRNAYAAPLTNGTLLGADQLGRAVEYRLLAGLGISLLCAAAVTLIATTLGLVMGLLGSFFGRAADRIVTAVIDVTWAYPTILLAVVIAGIQGPGVSTVIWALGLTLWSALARIVRAQVLVLREQDYVLAARALGYGRVYISLRHLVPNLVPVCILMGTLFVALTIIAEAGLSFIGLGAQSPTPSLGKTLAEGFSFASSSPWPLVFGSLTIIALVTTLNALGDHLRDMLDPRGVLPLPAVGLLLGPAPLREPRPAARPDAGSALAAEGVSVAIRSASDDKVPVLTDLTLSLDRERTLGIVGESGSGKSVAARALLGLLPAGLAQVDGRVLWQGRDLATLDAEALRAQRGRFIALVFQDARASMDPLYTIGAQIVETLQAHFPQEPASARKAALEMLARVGLSDPAFFDRYPHQLSGGQMQRAALAAVLVLRPQVLIADEPTTGLDATTQKKIVALVRELRREMGMTVIWISHDLDLVSEIADDVVVMYAGQIVETGAVAEVLRQPAHPYTKGLIESRPGRGARPKSPLPAIAGNVPEPGGWPAACRFLPRCRRAVPICSVAQPGLDGAQGRRIRCHNPVAERLEAAT